MLAVRVTPKGASEIRLSSYTGAAMGSRRRGRSWLLATATLALALSSCAPSSPDTSPGPAATGASPSAAPSPQPTEPSDDPTDDVEVPRELRFTAPALGGGTIDGSDYAGSDLVIWFWAPW